MTHQIPMHFAAPPSYGRDDFVISQSNHAAYDLVMGWPRWSAHALWLCGESGSGKTHLAHVWKEAAQARTLEGDLPAQSADAFGNAAALLLDDVNISGQEEALFHLLNHTKEQGKWLLLVQAVPPARLPVALPDLASRLRALPVASMAAPDDMLLQAVMMKQLADKQLRVAPEVVQYLLKRLDRSCAAVRAAVEYLDQAALAQGRSITLPFVKEIFTNF